MNRQIYYFLIILIMSSSNIFSHPSPRQSVSIGKNISDLKSEYKNPAIVVAFQKLQERYESFRNIRGDGNCFVRAAAFSYITLMKYSKSDQIFEHWRKINLLAVQKDTIPKQFKSTYTQAGMQLVIKQWDRHFQQCQKKKPTLSGALAIMLNTHWVYDFLIILYFRSLCLYQFYRNRHQYQHYEMGTDQEIMNSYGMESEGLMLKVMADALKADIIVNQIDRKEGYIEMRYDADNSKSVVHLLFKPGHYDVLEKPNPKKHNPSNNVGFARGGIMKTMIIQPAGDEDDNNISQRESQGQRQKERQGDGLKEINNKVRENKNPRYKNQERTLQFQHSDGNKNRQDISQNVVRNREDGCLKCKEISAMFQTFSNCFVCGWKLEEKRLEQHHSNKKGEANRNKEGQAAKVNSKKIKIVEKQEKQVIVSQPQPQPLSQSPPPPACQPPSQSPSPSRNIIDFQLPKSNPSKDNLIEMTIKEPIVSSQPPQSPPQKQFLWNDTKQHRHAESWKETKPTKNPTQSEKQQPHKQQQSPLKIPKKCIDCNKNTFSEPNICYDCRKKYP